MTTTHPTPTENLDSIMLKVRKLQRLAERGGTPEESAAAAAKVAELMERYAIDHATIEGLADPDERRGLGNEYVQTTSAAWRRLLLFEVAKDHRCRAVYFPGRGTMDLVGSKDDIEIVKTMWQWLCGQVESHLRVTWAAEGKDACEANSYDGWNGETRYYTGYSPTSWKKSYREGAVAALRTRIRAAREEREARRTQGDSTALMVLDDKVVALYRELHPRVVAGRRRQSGGGGYGLGHRDGSNMALASGGNLGAGALRLGSR